MHSASTAEDASHSGPDFVLRTHYTPRAASRSTIAPGTHPSLLKLDAGSASEGPLPLLPRLHLPTVLSLASHCRPEIQERPHPGLTQEQMQASNAYLQRLTSEAGARQHGTCHMTLHLAAAPTRPGCASHQSAFPGTAPTAPLTVQALRPLVPPTHAPTGGCFKLAIWWSTSMSP